MSYLMSFVAACGLLYFAMSIGYYLGLRDRYFGEQPDTKRAAARSNDNG